MSYRKIGDLIQLVDVRNKDLSITHLVGLTINKKFIPSVANTIGTDMSNYKIIRKNQFACSTMQVRRDKKMPVALLKQLDVAIISQAYPVFEVIDENEILPEYLMLWFTRSEFDREACFHAVGGVRGSLEWEDFCNMELPVPSIEKQREIVAQYQAVANKIKVNEQICEKLEATAQTLYKQWFVDFEFPHSPPLEGCPQDGVVKRSTQNYMSLPYNPALKERAKELRKAGNLAEVLFWQQVRNKQFRGLDFDRQKIIGNYIVDFYNANYQVVIEIDGNSHDEKQDYDSKRQDYLERLGLKVIRYTDSGVKRDIDSVMRHLDECFEEYEKSAENEVKQSEFHENEMNHPVFHEKQMNHPAFQAPLQRRGTLGYKSSGGKMVWNEELEKEVPEGWEVKSLSDISKITMGQSPEGEYYNEKGQGKIFYQGRTDFGFRIPEVRIFTTLSKKNAKKGDILMSVRAPVGDLNIADSDCSIGRGIAALSSKESSYLFYLMKSFKSHFELSDGTGTIFSSINKYELFNLKLIYDESYSKYFHEKIKYIDHKIIIISKQNQKLTQLQSLLLSRLAGLEG
ncbi:MAG: DUF559 domain-containing protein [Flavobacteriaceae bacterium]|jgi:very-short-patch-repair endonuclease|nr:DUF559 domain-containing protein [Flavobacteriaceae bacterium]